MSTNIYKETITVRCRIETCQANLRALTPFSEKTDFVLRIWLCRIFPKPFRSRPKKIGAIRNHAHDVIHTNETLSNSIQKQVGVYHSRSQSWNLGLNYISHSNIHNLYFAGKHKSRRIVKENINSLLWMIEIITAPLWTNTFYRMLVNETFRTAKSLNCQPTI